MKNRKKPTLAELEARVVKLLAAYVQKHRLLPQGKKLTLMLEVECHETIHFYGSESKVTRVGYRTTGESMTEEDWNEIFSLPIFKKETDGTISKALFDALTEMHQSDQPLNMPAHHVQQMNMVFQGNGLMDYIFKVSGSTSTPWRRQPMYKVSKRC